MNPNCIVSCHHFGSTSKGITLNDNLFWILGHFIALPISVSLGSMNVIDGIMYLARCSFVLGINYIIYIYIYIECETMLHHPTIVVQLLHLFFHSFELQFDLIVFVDLRSPCDSHSSPFHYSYPVNRLL